MKKQNGITLIALIITIIVMLILVGVTVATISDGGIFQKATKATKETEEKAILEEMIAMMDITDDRKINPDAIIAKMQKKYTVEYSKPNATITGKFGTYNYIVSETGISIAKEEDLGEYYLDLLNKLSGLTAATDEELEEVYEVLSQLEENSKFIVFGKANEDDTYIEEYFILDGYMYYCISDHRGEEDSLDIEQIPKGDAEYNKIISIAKEKSDIRSELIDLLIGYPYTYEDLNNGTIVQHIENALQKDCNIRIKDSQYWYLSFESSFDNSFSHDYSISANYDSSTSLYSVRNIE